MGKAEPKELMTLEECLFPIPTKETTRVIDEWLAPAKAEKGVKVQQWVSQNDRKGDEKPGSTDIFRGGYTERDTEQFRC